MDNFFYHLKPEKMLGKKLLPISLMEKEYPALAKKQLKIYERRESLLKKKIPPLDCTWKDVIFLSCLNPRLIFAALELLGLLKDEIPTILKFPISVLKGKEFCLFEEQSNKMVFTPCSVAKYKEEEFLPSETLKYFINALKKDEDPLIFSSVKHLLLKGELDLDKAEEIEYHSLYEDVE